MFTQCILEEQNAHKKGNTKPLTQGLCFVKTFFHGSETYYRLDDEHKNIERDYFYQRLFRA